MAAVSATIPAVQANETGLLCKYGHFGTWTSNGSTRSGRPTRYCLECKRIRMRRYNYDLSQDEYVAMLERQNYQCAICHQEVKLVVDHNHDTGKVRGLLCNICNLGLGLVETRGFMDEVHRYLEMDGVS